MEGEFDKLNVPDQDKLYRIQEVDLVDSQQSPFTRSRYGRPRKPKQLSDDFFGIDNLFEVENVKNDTRVSVQMNSPATSKVVKTKPESANTREEHKALHVTPNCFAHVTAESELDDVSVSSEVNDINLLLAESLALNSEPESDFSQNDYSINIDLNINNLYENALLDNTDSLDDVLQLIAPDKLSDSDNDTLDAKSNSKPALKTYTNKKKSFNKQGTVESFALPDKPLFLLDNDGDCSISNELKRCKDLDAPRTSDMDINLRDKSLVNTPWKIASMNTDMNSSETLLEVKYPDASDKGLEDDILGTGNSNRVSRNNIGGTVKETKLSLLNEMKNEKVSATNENNSSNLVVVPFDSTFKTNNQSENMNGPISKQLEVNDKGTLNNSKKHSSKSKTKHKHKSRRRHHHHRHKGKTHSDVSKLRLEGDSTSKLKKHKSSKNKSHHKSKSKLNNEQHDVTEEKAGNRIKKISENSTDALIEVLMTNMENKEVISKPEEVLSIIKQHSLIEKPIKSVGTVDKQSKTESLKKLEQILLSKPNKVVSKIGHSSKDKKKSKISSVDIKMFDKPLFSIPDATIRQVPSTLVKDIKKYDTNLKTDIKEKSNIQVLPKESNIKNKNDESKVKANQIKDHNTNKEETVENADAKVEHDENKGDLSHKLSKDTKRDGRNMGTDLIKTKDIKVFSDAKESIKESENRKNVQTLLSNLTLKEQISDIPKNDTFYMDDQNTKSTAYSNKDNKTNTGKLYEKSLKENLEMITSNDEINIPEKQKTKVHKKGQKDKALMASKFNEEDINAIVEDNDVESIKVQDMSIIVQNELQAKLDSIDLNEYDISLLKEEALFIDDTKNTNAIIADIQESGTNIMVNSPNLIEENIVLLPNKTEKILTDNTKKIILCDNIVAETSTTYMQGNHVNEIDDSGEQFKFISENEKEGSTGDKVSKSSDVQEIPKHLDDEEMLEASNILKHDENIKVIRKTETVEDYEHNEVKTINDENKDELCDNNLAHKFDTNNEDELSIKFNQLEVELMKLPETLLWDKEVPGTCAMLEQDDYLKISELNMINSQQKMTNSELSEDKSNNTSHIKSEGQLEIKNEENLSIEKQTFDGEQELSQLQEASASNNGMPEVCTTLAHDEQSKATGETVVAVDIEPRPLKTTEIKKDKSSKCSDTSQRRSKEKLKINNKEDLYSKLDGPGEKSKNNLEISELPLLPKTREKKIPLRFQQAMPETRKELKVVLENQNFGSEKSKKQNENNRLKNVVSQEMLVDRTKTRNSEDIKMPKNVTYMPESETHSSVSESSIIDKSVKPLCDTKVKNKQYKNKAFKANSKKLYDSKITNAFRKQSESTSYSKKTIPVRKVKPNIPKNDVILRVSKQEDRHKKRKSTKGSLTDVNVEMVVAKSKADENKKLQNSKTTNDQNILKHSKRNSINKTENKHVINKSTDDKKSSMDVKELWSENIDENVTSNKNQRGQQPIKRIPLARNIASQSMIEISNEKSQIARSSSAIEILKQSFRTTNRQRRAASVCCGSEHSIVPIMGKAHSSPLSKPIKRKLQENTSLSSSSDTTSALIQKTISSKEITIEKPGKVTPKRNPVSINLDVLLKLDPTKVKVGDLMWARVGNYPYWPCLITMDPLSNAFQKNIGAKYKIHPSFHVRFYADKGRRSWISSVRLMLYKTKNDLQEIHDLRSAQQSLKIELQPYVVKPNLKPTWDVAVTEADSMKSKNVKERLEFFSNLIESIANAKKKPLDARIKLNFSRNHSSEKTKVSDENQVRSRSLSPLINRSPKAVLTEDKDCFTCPLPKFAQVKRKDLSGSLFNESSNSSTKDTSDNIILSTTDVNKSTDQVDTEHSVLESDPLSKSSSSKIPPIKIQKMLKRQKRYNLFKRIPKYRVCQICTKPQEVLRCQGPCNGFFHEKCAKEVVIGMNIAISENENAASSTHYEQVCGSKAGADMSSSDAIIENNASCSNHSSDGTESEHITRKIKSVDYSVAEQIDLKMEELMLRQDNYTSDYTSSDENWPSSTIDSADNRRKSLKFKNVNKDMINNNNGCGIGPVTTSEAVLIRDSRKSKGALLKASSVNTNKFENGTKLGSLKQGSDDAICNSTNKDVFKCQYCTVDIAPPCFVCEKEVSAKDGTLRQKCSINKCGRFYHPQCLNLWPQTQWSLIQTIRLNDKDLDKLFCPSHVCHSCSSDNPRARAAMCRGSQVVRCLRCPAIYHSTNYCVPAGTYILTNSQIICPRHFESPIKRRSGKKSNSVINASWCFICLVGGNLIYCQTCPTSVHSECIKANYMEDGTFICDDCETGRLPLYDEVVWAKLGVFRWWPATILFPSEVPENIEKISHNKGEFVVKFFGTYNYNWISRGKVFPFQDEDRKHSTTGKSRIDISYNKSLEEASTAFDLKMNFLAFRENILKNGYKPPPYIRVRKNKPVGLLRVYDPNMSNPTPCECSPSRANPCGPYSDCLNRILSTECDPNICPAKDKCENQQFEKRQYPLLVPYKTENRGWGLKTQVPISKGAFVIEYVGELINEREYQRRIRKMHDSKSEDYYFLTIDKDRIIDAGPKGNLARFMNHCCQPNCQTEKWTVNGDTRIGLFATEDIPADTEVTFNYQLQSVGKEMKVCACGAPNCSGFIGDKPKLIESQKKTKKTGGIKRKRESSPPVIKSKEPCFVCGKYGAVGACQKKKCTKFYHLKCVGLKVWPQDKWACPWHNCNMCDKRTIRGCVKCIKSYCPSHSEGNIHYRNQIGYICVDHDPDKESQAPLNQSSNVVENLSSINNVSTNEVDISLPSPCNTEKNEGVCNSTHQVPNLVSSTPIKKKNYGSFVHTLKTFEAGFSAADDFKKNLKQTAVSSKRKRDSQKEGTLNPKKKIKFSSVIQYSSSTNLNTTTQSKIKLSPTVSPRRLRTNKKILSAKSGIKHLTKRSSAYEHDLSIRKRSKPRY